MHINKYDIIVITETKVSKNKRLHFSGYKTFKSENEINCGGVAIIIKQGIEFNCIGTWKVRSQNIEVLGIRTKNLTINYNLVAVYRKPYGTETKGMGGYIKVWRFKH